MNTPNGTANRIEFVGNVGTEANFRAILVDQENGYWAEFVAVPGMNQSRYTGMEPMKLENVPAWLAEMKELANQRVAHPYKVGFTTTEIRMVIELEMDVLLGRHERTFLFENEKDMRHFEADLDESGVPYKLVRIEVRDEKGIYNVR